MVQCPQTVMETLYLASIRGDNCFVDSQWWYLNYCGIYLCFETHHFEVILDALSLLQLYMK